MAFFQKTFSPSYLFLSCIIWVIGLLSGCVIGVDLGLLRAGGLGVLRGMMTESSSSRLPNLLSLGDLNEIMCLQAIAGSEMAMRDLGIPVQAGSGVAAAIEYYRGATGAAALKNAA